MVVPDPPMDSAHPALTEATVPPDPVALFRTWFELAQAAQLPLPEAMTLATATADGRPSARMVLLRGLDEKGFVFFTNYDSRKGAELAANLWAALVFHWPLLEKQVRIEGAVEKVSPEDSDRYFQTRPWGSRLSAWASPQSQVIPGRDFLEARMQELEAEHVYQPVRRPPYWGGYRVVPDMIEFWQGRPDRLHDRFRYQRLPDRGWRIERLAP